MLEFETDDDENIPINGYPNGSDSDPDSDPDNNNNNSPWK